jgi:hypothetical protein
VRAGVASNPSTPTGVIASLAKDRRVIVRVGAAGNPSVPTTILTELARLDVRRRAAPTHSG